MAGPNHVLPTGGTARFFSPLNVDRFHQENKPALHEPQSVEELGPDVIRFAESEGLYAHGNAIRLRLEEEQS